MRREEDTPVEERFLLIECHADETALTAFGKELPQPAANEAVVFLGYNYADVPVGRQYTCCFRRDEATTVVAVTQQYGRSWDHIPHGWKTLSVLRFEPETPAMIRELPHGGLWYDHRGSVCVSDTDTWGTYVAGEQAREGGPSGEHGLRPAGAGLFAAAAQGEQGERSLGQEFRELGDRGHGGHVVQHQGEWWVEPTVG